MYHVYLGINCLLIFLCYETKYSHSLCISCLMCHSCWITDDSFFYSLNLVYFTLIFIFNSGILVTVASSICKIKVIRHNLKAPPDAEGKTWRDPAMASESCRSGLTVLGLTCLMGTTWGLAFLGSGYTNYPVIYLFCILNSLQGLLSVPVGVCICVSVCWRVLFRLSN